jgi:hypothetical protein
LVLEIKEKDKLMNSTGLLSAQKPSTEGESARARALAALQKGPRGFIYLQTGLITILLCR